MSRSICDNLEKDCLVSNVAPNANPMQSGPFLLIWILEPSEPDDRPVDRPVDRPTQLMFNTLKIL